MNTFATKRVCNSNGDQESDIRRGPWTLEEDSQLIHYIARHGEGHWNMLAKLAGLKRTGKSCRLRWLNYLKPDIKRGNLTPKEQLLILELHSKFGNRWSKIAQHLPGRTDNEIKNYWRTRVQKQARQLNIDSGSKTFLDAVRCFWMPTMLQKMEENSSASSSPNSLTSNSAGGPSDFSMLTSSMAPPVVPPPVATVDMHHNENKNTDAYNLSIWQQLPEIAEWPRIASASHAIDISNTDVSNNLINNSYFVDSDNYYDMVELNSNPMSNIENNNMSQFGCHVEESDWVLDNMADALWNMDAM